MSTVFLSYRRRDAAGTTGRIHDWLERRYGADEVFMDIEDIPPGVDFRDRIRSFIEEAMVVLAIIGPGWNALDEDGRRRPLSRSRDWVRVELLTALGKGVPVVPVCVDGARIPHERHLPKILRQFAYKQAEYVDSGRRFRSDVDSLVAKLDEIITRRRAERLHIATPTVSEPPMPSPASVVVRAVPQKPKTPVGIAEPPMSATSVAEGLVRELRAISRTRS